jgi:hypothetical protein
MKQFTLSRIKPQIIWLIATLGPSGSVWAVQVGPDAFTPQAIVEDYEGLGLPNNSPTPVVLGADSYTTDSGIFRYFGSFGALIGRTGAGVGNDTEVGYIDIALGNPVLRAGLYVGADAIWATDVSFFDVADNLLGTVSVAGGASIGQFAGWQADTGLIGRIRVTDTPTNARIIIIDDFITEGVPEPTALSLLVIGMAAFSTLRKLPRT